MNLVGWTIHQNLTGDNLYSLTGLARDASFRLICSVLARKGFSVEGLNLEEYPRTTSSSEITLHFSGIVREKGGTLENPHSRAAKAIYKQGLPSSIMTRQSSKMELPKSCCLIVLSIIFFARSAVLYLPTIHLTRTVPAACASRTLW